MKWLLKMVETVRSSGTRGGISTEYSNEQDELGKADSAGLDRFFRTVEQCHPFVFESPVATDFQAWLSNTTEPTVQEPGGRVFAGLDSAPFPIFSIECLNGPIASRNTPVDDDPIWCVLAAEIAPLEFNFYMLIGSHKKEGIYFVAEGQLGGYFTEQYVLALKDQVTGVEAVKERVRLGSGGTKRQHEIRRLIRVCPRSDRGAVRSISGRPVDWTHRWVTRGHWRRREGLGKDRAGNYSIHGFTWVKEHEKGPAEAPLIANKVRLVPELDRTA
jgi:hypothetical protein